IMSQELPDEQLPVYALAILGGLFLAVRRPRWGLPLAAWPLANLALLLVYSPLQFKHVAILLPPIALVVGTALANVGLWPPVSGLWSPPHGPEARDQRPETPVILAAVGLGAWYLSSLPAVLRQDWQVMSAATESRVETYAEEASLVPRLT